MTREEAVLIAEASARLPRCAFEAVNEVAAELSRAMGKFGAMRGPHEGYAVILEELDELWDEIKRRDIDPVAMRKEAVQVAAMALRFVADVCGDKGEIIVKLNNDPEWLKRKAEQEDGCFVSVGGLVTDVERQNPPKPGPHRYAWGTSRWYVVWKDGTVTKRRFRTKAEATEFYRENRAKHDKRGLA